MARPIQDAVMLMGDSITSRQDVPLSLNALFSELYRRDFDILNRGLGAYNTRFYLPLLDQILLHKSESPHPQQIKLVTIWFGANDSVLSEFDQHVPLEEYISNLESILINLTSSDSHYEVAQQNTGVDIVLITPPPIYPSMMEGEDFAGKRVLENTRKYAEGVVELGKKWKLKEKDGKEGWKISTVDMFNGILDDARGDQEELTPYFTDGLHLSTKGYNIFWQRLLHILENDFKGRGVAPSELKFSIPDWNTLDLSNRNSAVDSMKNPYKRV